MPEMNGYEATAAIRRQEGPDRSTPDHRDDRRGAPRGSRTLSRRRHGQLSRQAGQQGRTARARSPIHRAHGVAPPDGVGDPTRPRRRRSIPSSSTSSPARGGDRRELRHRGHRTFVHDTEPLLLQLREAFEAASHAVGRIAHSIKGSCGQLGGRRLAVACDRLESKATDRALANGQADLGGRDGLPGAEPTLRSSGVRRRSRLGASMPDGTGGDRVRSSSSRTTRSTSA